MNRDVLFKEFTLHNMDYHPFIMKSKAGIEMAGAIVLEACGGAMGLAPGGFS